MTDLSSTQNLIDSYGFAFDASSSSNVSEKDHSIFNSSNIPVGENIEINGVHSESMLTNVRE